LTCDESIVRMVPILIVNKLMVVSVILLCVFLRRIVSLRVEFLLVMLL